MFDFLKKKSQSIGSVLFRGNMQPRLAEFDHLADSGIDARPIVNLPDDTDWAIELQHPQWGKAELICPRKPMIPPRFLVELDPRLSEDDVRDVLACDSALLVQAEGKRDFILRDRKLALRFMHAVMGQDGVAVCDHISERFWSRVDLEDELAHDADLDIESLYTLHAVTEDEGGPCTWLHTHGLGEMGLFDFDILRPSDQLTGEFLDCLRAIAFAIVEGKATMHTQALPLVHPNGVVRFVDVPTFEKHARPQDIALRDDPNRDHYEKRAILCEPATGLLARFSKRVRPAKWLTRPIDETTVVHFTNAATELMAERARNTYDVLRRYAKEVREFELPVLVKLGYVVDDGDEDDREHLWFEVHTLHEDHIDATLVNQPLWIERMTAGDRGMHDIELLTDWTILTPAGQVNPRNTTPLHILRAHADELREAMREADQ